MNVFDKALEQALRLLNSKGRLCVITFHSLEDKLCKNKFKEVGEIDKELKKLPIIPKEYQKDFEMINSIKPSKQEIEKNKRSRSSRLRILERV